MISLFIEKYPIVRFATIMYFLLSSLSGYTQDSTSHDKRGMFKTFREALSFAGNCATRSCEVNLTDTIVARVDSLANTKSEAVAMSDSVTLLTGSGEKRSGKSASGISTITDSVDHTFNKPVENVNGKISAANEVFKSNVKLENEVSEPINNIESTIDHGLAKATDGNVQNPLGGVNANTEVDMSVDKAGEGNLSDHLPGVDTKLPIDVQGENLELSGLKEKAYEDIPRQTEIQNVTGNVNELDSKLATGEKYEGAVKDAASGEFSSEKLQNTVEEQAGKIEPVSNFNAQTQKLAAQQAEYEALIQKYKDKKALQAEIERKAKNVVNDRLNQHSPAFREAQEQLSKTKKLQGDVQSYKKLKEEAGQKRVNEMKSKPFHERVVPGITLQAYTQNNVFTTDWGLQSGYKLTTRWLAGAGVTYRSSFSEDHKTWVKGEGVYGYRTYLNFGLVKGLYAHGEFAASYGNVTTRAVENPQRHAYNVSLGLGKKYAITPKLDGAIVVLYRAHIDGENSNLNKIAMRIEFNYNTKKRKKLF